MGEVWRARDTVADRIVALKVLPLEWAQNEVFQQWFRREVHLAARLSDPHVVPIHSYGEIEGRLYVDMRLIEGHDLHALLTEGPLDPARAVMIVEQVAMALESAHQSGLVHRDVKPSNILIAQFDFAYLLDFGIARAAAEAGLTSTGAVIGAWHYMAPERFKGGPLDARCDVYALACVLHECLTGSRPFAGETFEQLVAAHLMSPPPQPSAVCAGVPQEFDAVIAKGMAKDPHERYQTSLQLAQAARAVNIGSAAGPSAGLPWQAVVEAAQTSNQHAQFNDAPQPPDPGTPVPALGSTSSNLEQRSTPDVERPSTPVAQPVSSKSIEAVLDYAVSAINRGDRETASALAGQVLAVDDGNADAEDLLAAPAGGGEIRRLTILFADVVDSTVLSTRLEPETYRLLVGRYREQVLKIVDRYEGHVGETSGDGILAVFGYPHPHENDVRRAVQAGLEITRNVARLSEQAKRRFDAQIQVRVGVHRGLVYLDRDQDDVYGLAANLAARVSSLAPPGAVVVSDAVEPLIRAAFDVEALPAAHVKGVEEAIHHHRVVGERIERDRGSWVRWWAVIGNWAGYERVGFGHSRAR